LWNPFEDIVPREKPKEEEKEDAEPEIKPPPKKNLSLLSFRDEAEDDDEISNFVPMAIISKKPRKIPPQKKNLKRNRDDFQKEEEEDYVKEDADAEKYTEETIHTDDHEDSPKEMSEKDLEREKVRKETEKLMRELKSKKRKKSK